MRIKLISPYKIYASLTLQLYVSSQKEQELDCVFNPLRKHFYFYEPPVLHNKVHKGDDIHCVTFILKNGARVWDGLILLELMKCSVHVLV